MLALVAVAASACGGAARQQAAAPGTSTVTRSSPVFRGHAVTPVYPAPTFALRDQSGRVVQLAQQRGKVVLVTFLYTHCPDVCPLIASRLNAALHLLSPADRARTRVLAISVDPEHDTPRSVDHFISEHRLLRQFRFLTGSRDRLRPIWQAYNVIAAPASERVVDHSAYTALVDARGRVRAYFDQTALTSDIAHDVRSVLPAQPIP
jgi:protein SCO1/2